MVLICQASNAMVGYNFTRNSIELVYLHRGKGNRQMGHDIFLTNMGIRIAQRRKELRITQEQLAEKMGVSIQTISCVELGKKAIRPENLANLCSHLNITADYILYGKRNEQQMNDTIAKLSVLTEQEYSVVKELIDLLYKQK